MQSVAKQLYNNQSVYNEQSSAEFRQKGPLRGAEAETQRGRRTLADDVALTRVVVLDRRASTDVA